MIQSVARVASAGPRALVLEVEGWPGHRPGQFAMLRLDPTGTREDPLLPRPMAIYRGSGDALEFRFKVVGRGTRILSELAPGAALGLVGPLGNGFEPGDGANGAAILVGGGTGIASLYELAARDPGRTRVLLGGATAADILGLADFEALGVELEVATEDGSRGRRGLVTELLRPLANDRVFACGPTGMMRRAAEIACEAGAACAVSLENTMACGFGVCLGCAVRADGGYRYVCSDGPVFDACAVDWSALA